MDIFISSVVATCKNYYKALVLFRFIYCLDQLAVPLLPT